VCGAQEARATFAIEGFAPRLVVCVRCGLGRLHPLPDLAQLASFYPGEYYGEPGRKFQGFIERLVRMVGERHIAFLTRELRPGSRVLDLGCGRGVILGALADRGFEVHGVELSAAAARGADPRAEIRIAARLEDAGYPDAFFDQVVIWHVFEHLADPRATLATVHRIIVPGGRLIVALPNFSSLQARCTGRAWFHLDLPRHLYHYPLAALRQLLAQAGFEIESEHHFSLRQNPFGWVQSAMNLCPGLPRNGLYALLHERPPSGPPPFSAPLRAALWICFALGAPLGLALTLLETALRSGATVHVVARRRQAY
jgi:2-polyprenyl-3-methyl-5-hydroxy-6-metoxy-1,4-benzoquinol methylase